LHDGFIKIMPLDPDVRPAGFRVRVMKSATINEDNEPWVGQPWTADNPQWADVEVPALGRRLYVSGADEWRISTPIVKVELAEVTFFEQLAEVKALAEDANKQT
jgi:hypothetical protein